MLDLVWWNPSINTSGHEFIRSTPVVADERVYVGTERTSLACLDLHTGEMIWERRSRRPHIKGCSAPPRLFEDRVLFVSYDGAMTAFERDGAVAWTTQLGQFIHSTPMLDRPNRRAFVAVETFRNRVPGGDFVAVSLDSGAVEWRVNTNDYTPCTPAFNGAIVVCASNNHTIYGMEPTTGAVVWSTLLPGAVKGQPAIDRTSAYVTTEAGDISRLRLSDGAVAWSVNVGARIRHGRPVLFEDKVVVVTGAGDIVALARECGESVWRARTGIPIAYSITPWRERAAFAVAVDSTVFRFDLDTGSIAAAMKLVPGAMVLQPVEVQDDYLFLTTNNRGLAAYRLNGRGLRTAAKGVTVLSFR